MKFLTQLHMQMNAFMSDLDEQMRLALKHNAFLSQVAVRFMLYLPLEQWEAMVTDALRQAYLKDPQAFTEFYYAILDDVRGEDEHFDRLLNPDFRFNIGYEAHELDYYPFLDKFQNMRRLKARMNERALDSTLLVVPKFVGDIDAVCFGFGINSNDGRPIMSHLAPGES